MRLIRLTAALLLLVLSAGCGKEPGQGEADQDDPVAQGRKLFMANGCNLCHGPEGRGDGPVARSLSPKPRDFADLSAYKRGPGLEQLEETIQKGLHTGQGIMPAFPNIPSEDRRRLALFIQSLQPK
ncbi:MAG: cytochrome c [Candidatus Latescibacteria bacterium]|nr:cytochrome c [Candidatus Latescibacterota bacterium]